MSRRRVTVESLATDAETDVEIVLVTLWQIGLESVDEPSDSIPPSWVPRARAALSIDRPSQQQSVDYWMKKLGLTRDEFADRLRDLGIELRPRVRRLPKGALKRVRRAFAPYAARPDDEVPEPPPPCPELVWHDVGTRKGEMSHLDEDDVLRVHDALVKDFALDDDPIDPPGVRSMHLLSSAIGRSQTSLGGELKYPTVEMAGAALLHSLVLNHPFHNGNKRTGLVALLVFLDRNGLLPTCDETSLFKFVLRVAQHSIVPAHCPDLADREVMAIAQWIVSNSRRIEKGERPLPWRRLRRILHGFGCTSEVSSRVGNRINITREVEPVGCLGRRSKPRLLKTQVAYGDEGRTVEKNTLNKVRHDLELDEDHGVDSRAFYEAEAIPDDFIQQYRTLLRRLAKL